MFVFIQKTETINEIQNESKTLATVSPQNALTKPLIKVMYNNIRLCNLYIKIKLEDMY